MLYIDKNLLWKKYKTLPHDLVSVIANPNNTDFINELAVKNSIESEASRLAEIMGAVIVGVIPIQKFRQTIQDELELDQEKAQKIAVEIRDKVFSPVSASLRKVHGLDVDPAARAYSTPHDMDENELLKYKERSGELAFQNLMRRIAAQHPRVFWTRGKSDNIKNSLSPELRAIWEHINTLYSGKP